jgi:hypothetical protein
MLGMKAGEERGVKEMERRWKMGEERWGEGKGEGTRGGSGGKKRNCLEDPAQWNQCDH